MARNIDRRVSLRLGRLMEKFHRGLFRRPSGLAAVARDAGGDEVFPGVSAAAVAREDVVDGERDSHAPAVLAGIPVTVKDFKSGEFWFRAGTLDEVRHADDRRQSESFRCGVNETGAVLQHFGFAPVDENDGAGHVTDI